MRRARGPSPSSPFRALAHHQAAHGNNGAANGSSAGSSSLLRSFNVETNPTRPIRPSPLTASTFPDMPLDLVDRIRSFPLFNSAPDDFLAAIGKHLRPQIHAAHDLILTEGDDAKAMYWLVRGVVAVTSRDGEAVYAELTPGAFFGEIGVLMDVPRTATIVARSKCLLVVLTKEDLQTELPRYPDMEKAIRQEAEERLTILKKKQQERRAGGSSVPTRSSDVPPATSGDVAMAGSGSLTATPVPETPVAQTNNKKKRKSPSPGIIEDPAVGGSALGSGYVNVRKTLKELPLFATLPPDILHFLGLSAQPKTYSPFTDIIRQGSPGNDIYFIVRGEAEVVHEQPEGVDETGSGSGSTFSRPRLTQGQYFGEVASLGLSRGRTATVRSITSVECLMISGDALDELWRRCPPGLKHQVEETARARYTQGVEEQAAEEAQKDTGGNGRTSPKDVEMKDSSDLTQFDQLDSPFGAFRDPWQPSKAPPSPISVTSPFSSTIRRHSVPNVIFTTPSKPSSPTKSTKDEPAETTRQPSDPDPFLSVDMENMRNRRRNSLAPPVPSSESSSSSSSSSSTPSVSNTASSLQAHPSLQIDSSSSNSSPLKLFTFPPQAPSPEKADRTDKSERGTASIIDGFNGINVQEDTSPSPPPRGFKKARTSASDDSADMQDAALSSSISSSSASSSRFPETALALVFQHLDFLQQIRAAGVCRHWRRILTTSPQLCTHIDLSPYSGRINDCSLSQIVAPFIGTRAVEIDISNCFHMTDEGFQVLWQRCGKNIKAWRMKSVWDVSANQILDMSENASGLEEIDWSNCRKVGDNLLARVVGWVVPQPPPLVPSSTVPSNKIVAIASTKGKQAQKEAQKEAQENAQKEAKKQQQQQQKQSPAPGTIIGCPQLQILDLSYCKHITDRSMVHLAAHAANRLRSLSLTRCTSVTDAGFQAWAPYRFSALTHLCLADCTYLSDNAIVSLVNAAKHLTHLDLSFCCALSDTATEVVALGLPLLQELRLAFCGSAVSDASLRCIALHLNDLRGLSVRGCVRVTGVGVDHVLDGCGRLAWLDASQCKNLASWVAAGGIGRWGYDERAIGGGHKESMLGQSSWKAANRRSLGLDPTCPPAAPGPAPLMRGQRRRARKPVMFVIEKGPQDGLR
ncbi:hypothetical protein SBRCBS47491_009630 [Sporothrix bragantina]|uniref:Cyclic nucleotide-binding domain-containing protein n=1 Tax=Sporothrix bragantina TaxID=671064 RepID=A0ABP0CWC0_9PEZI